MSGARSHPDGVTRVRTRFAAAAPLRFLTLLHRWLGIAGNLLFVVWFASALVMMYARMPALDPGERLNRLPSLDVDAVTIGPGQAAAAARLDANGAEVRQLRLGMAGDRPVYRFRTAVGWTAVYTDTGSPLLQVSERQALEIASTYVAGNDPSASPVDAPLTYDAYLNGPDQWTLQLPSLFPLHRVRTGSHVLYVSDRTAEVVMATTPGSRFWGTSGAVFHWLYFTPLRSHSTVWYQLVVWAAVAGCVLTLSGLAVGVARLWRRRRSPYAGILRWHHYSGLVFGTATFAWVLSGALSMDPFGWHGGRTASHQQHAAVAGGALHLGDLDVDSLRRGLLSLREDSPVREVELLQFQGELLMLAWKPPLPAVGTAPALSSTTGPDGVTTADAPATTATPHRGRYRSSYASGPSAFLDTVQPLEHRLIETRGGEARRFDREELVAAAAAAMPASRIVATDELTAYDAYYGDRRLGRHPLPVLRVRFDDQAATWLYLDPALGRIVHSENRQSRLDRWLYRGLHRLDFPGFYDRRPLWDVVVIVLLLGGLFSSASSLAPAARRLRRHGARLRRRRG